MDRSEANTDSRWTWHEGLVDLKQAHFQIRYVRNLEYPDESFLVAYVSPPKDHAFTVQLLPENLPGTVDSGSIVRQVRRELDLYVIENGESDPMKYLRYHCTTASNIYSQFQWAYVVFEPTNPPIG
ncbi:MAG: hypothetical protein ABL970_00905 [Nitrospira sp.]